MGQGNARGAGAWRVRYWALHLVPAGLLVSALDPWPYGYYTLLSFVVSIAALWLAFLIYQRDKRVGPWSIVFVAAAILFNPVIPIVMPSDIWIVYIATAALFLVHFFATRTEPSG